MALLLAIGIFSGRKVKDAKSFTTGGSAGSWMVCGTIMGTLVGGQSTIGTAQMAFSFGISAWWFTIGTSLGTLVLGLFYVGPLRRSGCTTLTEIIAKEYGRKAESVGSVLCLLGIFISIVAQILSSSAMMTSLFRMPMVLAAVLSAVFIMLFVLFGGIRSAGAGGIVKLLLLYVSSIAAGVLVWSLSGGLGGLNRDIAEIYRNDVLAEFNNIVSAEDIHQRYNNLLARGPLKDLGAGLSLILGVLSTQTYAQALWSAKSNGVARRGALMCVVFTPLIGAACTLVGLYMRAHYITEAECRALLAAGGSLPEGVGLLTNSAEAFSTFITQLMPGWLGGIVLGTLFVTILGGGSGLALGAATIMVHDVIDNFKWGRRLTTDRNSTTRYRWTIVVLLAIGIVVSLSIHDTFINDLGFLSLGLRATAILFPLCCALFFPRRFKRSYALASMVVGTVAMFAAYCLALPLDPSYWGIGAGMIVMMMGWKGRGRKAGVAR